MWSRGPFLVALPFLWCQIQKIITETDGAELTAVFSPGGLWVQALYSSLLAHSEFIFEYGDKVVVSSFGIWLPSFPSTIY